MPGPRREWQIKALHQHEGDTTNKFYAVRIDLVNGSYNVSASWGRADAETEQGSKKYAEFPTLSAAQRKMEEMLHKKEREGYVNIEGAGYGDFLTLNKVLSMIDSSRIYGYADAATPPVPPPLPAGSVSGRSRGSRTANTDSPSGQSTGPTRANRQINM